jgi:hypothetical protein
MPIHSVEVVGIERRPHADALKALDSHRQHAVLVLQHALDEQKRLANDRQPFKIAAATWSYMC